MIVILVSSDNDNDDAAWHRWRACDFSSMKRLVFPHFTCGSLHVAFLRQVAACTALYIARSPMGDVPLLLPCLGLILAPGSCRCLCLSSLWGVAIAFG